MKKIVSFIICTVFVLSLIPTGAVFAADSGTSHTGAVELLDSLDMLPDSFNPNSKISREKFVVFLINALGLDGISTTKPIPFADVTPGTEAYGAVCTAYELGIINGSGTSFMPKETVSYNQALKMIVASLGYGEVADARGGYPYGYVSIANSLELGRGLSLSGDDSLKGVEVAVLIYNALGATVLQVASVGDGSVTYSDSAEQTMLDVYHGIVRIEGQLRATSGNVLSGNYEPDSDQILIDGTMYKTDGKNYDSLVGYTVYAYMDKSTDKIIAAEKVPDYNRTVVIGADQIMGFAGGVLTYEISGKEKRVSVDSAADISYNGRPAMSADAELFDLNDGDITFIDSDSDNKYDSIIISDFENYVVSAVNAADKIITDLYTPGKLLSIGETDEIFVDDFGNTMYYEELKKYDVISVWKSTDGKNIKMRYSNKEIRGTLTEKSSSDDGYLVINGETIKVSKGFIKHADDIKLGSKGIFALDASGKVAAFKESDTAGNYAYLIQAGGSTSKLDEKFMIRMMKPDGSIVIRNCDTDKLKIDGYPKTATEAKACLTKSQLIRYDTNGAGDIVMIDTVQPGTGDEDLLIMTYSAYNGDYTINNDKRLRYSKGAKLFSGKVAVEASTPIFNVPHPETVEDDKNYYITNSTIYSSATYVPFEAYQCKGDGVYSDILISYQLSGKGQSIATKTPVTVVEGVSAIVDEDGNNTYKLSCYYDGSTYREYFFEDVAMYKEFTDANGNPHKLEKGDIVRLNVNSNSGVIKRIDLVYDRAGDKLAGGATIGEGDYFLSERFVKGRVFEKDGDFITLTQEDNLSSDTELDFTQKELHILYSNKILVYDSSARSNQLTVGSVNDVQDFMNFGDSCSTVVIFSVDGGDNSIVVVYK